MSRHHPSSDAWRQRELNKLLAIEDWITPSCMSGSLLSCIEPKCFELSWHYSSAPSNYSTSTSWEHWVQRLNLCNDHQMSTDWHYLHYSNPRSLFDTIQSRDSYMYIAIIRVLKDILWSNYDVHNNYAHAYTDRKTVNGKKSVCSTDIPL